MKNKTVKIGETSFLRFHHIDRWLILKFESGVSRNSVNVTSGQNMPQLASANL